MACYFPFRVDNPNFGRMADAPAKIPVPCGKCPYCLQRRANNWVFRCMQETKRAKSAIWVTFTYDQPPLTDNGFMTLRKSDFQNFIKRLRKYDRKTPEDIENNLNIKYYSCGEYGSKTQRPHYHAVIFNTHQDFIVKAWDGFTSLGDENGVKLGFTTFDEVNENTVMYTAKYMNKGRLIPMFEKDDRIPEFQLFSKNLGSNFLTDATIRHYHANPTKSYVTVDGFKKPLPRYFRTKLDYPEHIKDAQIQFAQTKANTEYLKQYDEYLLSRAPAQTFEEFRYARKTSAIEYFRQSLNKRKKI